MTSIYDKTTAPDPIVSAALSLGVDPANLRPLSGGSLCEVWASEQLVFRVETMNIDSASRRFVVLKQLYELGVAVPEPIVEPTFYEGFVVSVSSRVAVSESPVDWEQFGAHVALLHATEGLHDGLPANFDLDAGPYHIERLAADGVLEPAYADMCIEVYCEAKKLVGSDIVLTHGDMWPKNIIVGRSGPVLCDWDFMGPGPALRDIGLVRFANDYELADVRVVGPIGLAAFASGYGTELPSLATAALLVNAHDALQIPKLVSIGVDVTPRLRRIASHREMFKLA